MFLKYFKILISNTFCNLIIKNAFLFTKMIFILKYNNLSFLFLFIINIIIKSFSFINFIK